MKLLKNELYKLFKMKKLYIFMIILLVNEVLAIYFHKIDGKIKTVIITENGQSMPLTFVKGTAQFMIIFIAIYLADIITDEYKNGTLKLSLLRPINRIEMLRSKIISLFIFIIIMLSFFVVSSYAAGTISFGWGEYTEYFGIKYTPIEGFGLTVTACLLLLLPYMAYGMIAAFIAVSSENMSTTIALSIGITTISQYLNAFDSIKIYSIVNQIYFFHDYFIKDLNWSAAFLSTAVCTLYMVLFYFMTANAIKKKDILC